MNTLLIVLAVLILAGLALYALHLWRQVWQRQRTRREAEQARRQRLGEDIKILAGSLLDEQMPLIEGAIRIKVLLDNYDHTLSNHARCAVFHQLHAATADIPTHAAWQALPLATRRQHERHFSELELLHKAAARDAARWLRDEVLPVHVSGALLVTH